MESIEQADYLDLNMDRLLSSPVDEIPNLLGVQAWDSIAKQYKPCGLVMFLDAIGSC